MEMFTTKGRKVLSLIALVASVACCDSAVADISPEAFLLATGHGIDFTGTLYQINASTGGSTAILPSQPLTVYGVDWDPVRQRVYWGVLESGTILSANLNGSDVTTVHQLQGCPLSLLGCETPNGVAVDYVEQLVFYADDVRNHIAVVSTDGSNHRVLLNTNGRPFGLALDLLREVVYYTLHEGAAMIGRVCYNGSAHVVVVGNLPTNASGIVLDRREGRLYWGSLKSKRIDSARTDGTDRRTILQEFSSGFGFAFLALLGDRLYFSDFESPSVRSVKTDGTGAIVLVPFLNNRVRGITAFDPDNVVTLAQKRDTNITICSVPVIPSTSVITTTPPSSVSTTAISTPTADSPLVIIALSVGLLVFVLVLVVAIVVVYRRKNSGQRRKTEGGDLISFREDGVYATPGSVSSHLPPPLLPVRPVDYNLAHGDKTASSGQSSAYVHVTEYGQNSAASNNLPAYGENQGSSEALSSESVPYLHVEEVSRSQPSLSRGEVAGGGRYEDSGRDFSSDSQPYTSVTPLHPERSAEPGTASMAVNQENTSASASARSFENAAFEEESSGNSLPYLSVSSINGLMPEEMAGNAPRETTPPPPCGRQSFKGFSADVTSSAVAGEQWLC